MAAPPPAALPRRAMPTNRRLTPSLPHIVMEAVDALDLKSVSRTMRPGQEIVSEGRRCSTVFVITEGIAIRYRILRDGQRQILGILLPGDFAGVVSCHFESALYSIKTLTQTTLSPIPLPRLLALFDTHPGLAAQLFWRFSGESTMLAERLIGIGRRPAKERVAHFLLELLVRLQAVGLADARSYRLPLTQEMIGDALGLSIPYLNRILHELSDEGLVRVKGQFVVIEEIQELSALADFEHGYLRPFSLVDLLPTAATMTNGADNAVKESERVTA
jgi:CRP-like cAMP-binding protein